MYIVEVKTPNGSTFEKEYSRKANALKCAEKVKNNGYIEFNNPELWKWQRKAAVKSVSIYYVYEDGHRKELN